MQIKKEIFRFLCACEIVCFVYVIMYSEHGYFAQYAIVQSTRHVVLDTTLLHKNVLALRTLLHDWHLDSFFLEKCLRERLDLMHSDDEIYFF